MLQEKCLEINHTFPFGTSLSPVKSLTWWSGWRVLWPTQFFSSFIYAFYSFLAVLGLRCSAGFSLAAASRGYSLVVARGLLLRWLLFWDMGSRAQAQQRCRGSAVVAHRLSFSMACGIFPDQGSNPGLLYWQAAFSPGQNTQFWCSHHFYSLLA